MNGPHAISMDGKPPWKIMKYVWNAKCVFLAKSDTNLYASSVTKGRILEYKLNTGEMLTLRRLEGIKTFLRHRDTLTWRPSLRSNELWSGKCGTPADMAASWGGAHGHVWGAQKGNRSHPNPGTLFFPLALTSSTPGKEVEGPTPYKFRGGVPLKLHQQCPSVRDRAALAWPVELVHHHQLQMIRNFTL